MRSLVRPEHVVSLIEQLYAEREATMQAWALALVPRIGPVFRRPGHAGLVVASISSARFVAGAIDGVFMSETLPPEFVAMIEGKTRLAEQFFRVPHPVGLRSELGPLPVEMQAMLPSLSQSDALGIVVEPEPDLGVAVSVAFLGAQAPATAPERALLTRVALHVEAAVRLRQRPDAVVGFVTPEGRVEMGSDAGEVRSLALGAAAQCIDRARTHKHRGDGEGALSVWPALVSGRLSFAERVDTDGKRLYDLYENAPKHEALRVLTEREGTVVHECARGLSNKEVSYALGISQAAVSQALASAAHKLGLTSVRSMVRLASGLRGAGSTVASIEKLSESERVVLALVAEGKSNAQIARARGSAERTVANQVAAILRKTGARSRRELSVGQT